MTSHRPHRSLALVGLAALVLAAGCGSADDDADASADDTIGVDTASTTAASTTAASTTAPPTTAAEALPGSAWRDLDEPLLLVRRVTENDGFFATEGTDGALPVEVRTFDPTCIDDCSSGTASVNTLSGTEEPTAFEFSFDDGTLTASTTTSLACFSPTTNEYDGPAETTLTATATLAVGEDTSWFSGPMSLRWTTPASAECAEEDLGYGAETVLFDPASTPSVPVVDDERVLILGEDAVGAGGRGIRPCEPTDPADCAAVLRTVSMDTVADGQTMEHSFEAVLRGNPDEGYIGGFVRSVSCVSDADGSFVALDGYVSTYTYLVRRYEVGEPVFVIDETISGSPHPSLTAEQAAVCSSYAIAGPFVGVISDDVTIEWDTPLDPSTPIGEDAPVTTGPPTTAPPTTVSQFDTGVENGSVVRSEALVRFLTYTMSVDPNRDAETQGLKAAVAAAGVGVVGPDGSATVSEISAFGARIDAGLPFATLDTSGVCTLAILAEFDGMIHFLMGPGSAADCTAYAALDAYTAGKLSPIS